MMWLTTNEDLLGYIPAFLHEDDPRPAREQFAERYAHGGGWSPLPGFTYNPIAQTIKYPGDPPYHLVGKAQLRDEEILVFPHGWVMIRQKDGSFEISRMD